MENSKLAPSYGELLAELRTKVDAFRTSTANEYIPRMYEALRNENRDISAKEARQRIQKDCAYIWKRRTILCALPDEAKDPKKQEAGRLSQKKAKSAAFSAAPSSYAKDMQVIISATGRTIENHKPIIDASLTDVTREDKSRSKNIDLLQFEFSLSSKDLWRSMILREVETATKEDRIWFNGVLDKHTGEVIFANMGRIPELQKDSGISKTHPRTTTLSHKTLQ